jgi:hypothetical protein
MEVVNLDLVWVHELGELLQFGRRNHTNSWEVVTLVKCGPQSYRLFSNDSTSHEDGCHLDHHNNT